VRVLCYSFIAISVIGLAGALLLPGTAIHQDQHHPAIRGFFAQKNIAGRVLLLGIICGMITAVSVRRSRILAIFTVATCTLAVIASLSATALLDLLIVLAVFSMALLWRRLHRSTMIFAGLLAILVVPWAIYIAYEHVLLKLIATTGRDITLTGRTLIWAELFSQVRESSPLLGFGYEAFWTADNGGAATTRWIGLGPYVPPQAHNGLIHALTALGLVGAALCIYSTFKLIAMSAKCLSLGDDATSALGVMGVTFSAYFFVINIAENEFLTYNSIVWCLFVSLYVYTAKAITQMNREER